MPTWPAPSKNTRSPGFIAQRPTWRPRQKSEKLEWSSEIPKCPYTKRSKPEQSKPVRGEVPPQEYRVPTNWRANSTMRSPSVGASRLARRCRRTAAGVRSSGIGLGNGTGAGPGVACWSPLSARPETGHTSEAASGGVTASNERRRADVRNGGSLRHGGARSPGGACRWAAPLNRRIGRPSLPLLGVTGRVSKHWRLRKEAGIARRPRYRAIWEPHMKRVCVLPALAVLTGALGASAASSRSSDLTNPKHFFWAPGQNPQGSVADSTANDLIYHGGSAGPGAIGVEQKPAVYLVYWGPQWAQGFQTADTDGKLYSSKTLQTYLNSFFQNVGGSPWANVQTQYCNGALPGSTSCVGGTGYVTNPTHQLKGVWTDPTPVPDDIIAAGLAQNLVDDPIAQEAMRASAHFKYDSQATYIILAPPSTIATGQPVYCGYHTQTTSIDGLGNPYRLQYAFIPW